LENARQAEELHRQVLTHVGHAQNATIWQEAQYELAWDLLAESQADPQHKADPMATAQGFFYELHAQAEPHSYWDARLLLSLGVVAKRYGQWDEALAYYDQVEEVFSPTGDAHNWGVLQQNRGSCYESLAEQGRQLGDTAACIRYRAQALRAYAESLRSFERARSVLVAEAIQRDLERVGAVICD
jgi:tetratricopeptide (TPR) repeat protein